MVSLDASGKLLSFEGIPYPGAPVEDIPDRVFRAAGLNRSVFHEVPPPLVPPHASDSVLAWKGPHPAFPDTELTVQVATWKGRLTQAAIRTPWQDTGTTPLAGGWIARSGAVLTTGGLAILWLLIILLARRNWKLGRTDRKGAVRIAIARFLSGLSRLGRLDASRSRPRPAGRNPSGRRRMALHRRRSLVALPRAGAGRPRQLAALDCYLEPPARRPLAGSAGSRSHPDRSRCRLRHLGRHTIGSLDLQRSPDQRRRHFYSP